MAPNIQGEPKECLWALLFDPYDQGGMSVQPKALWGVYNANGGIAGELAYVFGKIRGTMHCALCDITHATVSKKDEWKTLEDECTLPLHLVHLNEQPPELEAVTRGATPCIVAESNDGWSILINAEELEACAKSVDWIREK